MSGLDSILEKMRDSIFDFVNLPDQITKENVNMKIALRDITKERWTFLEYACLLIVDDYHAIRCLLELGAESYDYDHLLIRCANTPVFHMLLQYGGNPNAVKSNGHYLWETEKDKPQQLLFEYGARPPMYDLPLEVQSLYLTCLDWYVTPRVNRCRRALLTLIWLAPKPLKSLFISWAKWIWSLKPYTNDLQPSIGPTSPVWVIFDDYPVQSRQKKKIKI